MELYEFFHLGVVQSLLQFTAVEKGRRKVFRTIKELYKDRIL